MDEFPKLFARFVVAVLEHTILKGPIVVTKFFAGCFLIVSVSFSVVTRLPRLKFVIEHLLLL